MSEPQLSPSPAGLAAPLTPVAGPGGSQQVTVPAGGVDAFAAGMPAGVLRVAHPDGSVTFAVPAGVALPLVARGGLAEPDRRVDVDPASPAREGDPTGTERGQSAQEGSPEPAPGAGTGPTPGPTTTGPVAGGTIAGAPSVLAEHADHWGRVADSLDAHALSATRQLLQERPLVSDGHTDSTWDSFAPDFYAGAVQMPAAVQQLVASALAVRDGLVASAQQLAAPEVAGTRAAQDLGHHLGSSGGGSGGGRRS